jgi:hypothetical protein
MCLGSLCLAPQTARLPSCSRFWEEDAEIVSTQKSAGTLFYSQGLGLLLLH